MILNVENPKTPKNCHLGWAIRPALTGPRPRPIKFLGKGVLPSLPNPSSPLSQNFPPTFFISISISRSNPNPETKTDIRDSEFRNTSATRKMNLCRAGRSSLNALRASKLVSPHRPISPLLLRHSHVLPPPFAAAAVRHLRTGREPPVRYPIVGTHCHLSKFLVQIGEIVIVSAILVLKFDGSGICLEFFCDSNS